MATLFMRSVSVGPKGVQVICLNELYLVRELLRKDTVWVRNSLSRIDLVNSEQQSASRKSNPSQRLESP